MASALATITKSLGRVDVGHRPGLLGFGLGTVAGFGTSVGLGNVYARYRDKWYGKYLPYIVAFVGKATAVGIAIGTGNGTAAAVANDVGQAGVNALGLNWGVKMALKSKKLKAVVMDEAEAAKLPASSLLGALNPSTARGMDRQAVDALYNQYC